MAGDPLDVLLSHAVLEITRAAERRQPDLNIVQWADFLRVADGATQKTMHLDARVSKRSITAHVKLYARLGALTVDDGVVHLTDDGRALRDAWGAAVESACVAFEARHGGALRSALEPVVASLELELPHYIHPYGTPDPSITGGRPHGADWRPVSRDRDADTTSDLSILALLSQALTAYSIEYEQRGGPMVWAVHLARNGQGPMPFGATFERHRFKPALVRKGYEPITAAIEATWAGAPALRRALEALRIDGTHADHPYVVFAPGKGFVEVSAVDAR